MGELDARCNELKKVGDDLIAAVEDNQTNIAQVTNRLAGFCTELRGELHGDISLLETRQKQSLNEAQRQWQSNLEAAVVDMSAKFSARVEKAEADSARESLNLREICSRALAQHGHSSAMSALTELHVTETSSSPRSPKGLRVVSAPSLDAAGGGAKQMH